MYWQVIMYSIMNHKELETGLESRTENIMVRMTPEEKQDMIAEAQKLGISLSAFFRLLLRNWASKVTFEKS